MKQKKFFLSSIFLILIVFFCVNCFSQDLDNLITKGEIPIPSDAEKISFFSNMNKNTIGYETNYDQDELFYFFKSHMEKNGWQDKGSIPGLLKDQGLSLPQVPSSKAGAIDKLMKKIKIFKNGDQTLILNVSPRPGSNKNVFTLSFFDMQIEEKKAQPMPSTVPVYPNAELIESMPRQRKYLVNDSPDNVFQFYKTKMPFNGWKITRETPVEMMNIGAEALERAKNLAGTSSCAGGACEGMGGEKIAPDLQHEIDKKGSMGVARGALEFQRSNGQKCRLFVVQIDTNTQWGKQTHLVIKY
jgi:hypothetical protein